jgi:hypothetical protein
MVEVDSGVGIRRCVIVVLCSQIQAEIFIQLATWSKANRIQLKRRINVSHMPHDFHLISIPVRFDAFTPFKFKFVNSDRFKH